MVVSLREFTSMSRKTCGSLIREGSPYFDNMDVLEQLRENLTEESKAYGYTLCVWGSGAILLNFFAFTVSNILMYILGGVVGFGILAFMAFKGFFKSVDAKHADNFIVASMIHILSSFGNVFLSWVLIIIFRGAMADIWLSLLIGIHVTFSYNILLLLEELLSEYVVALEAKLAEKLA